ncbi:S-adenosyl-L-methionine-dependent methyltransferase [Ilyonectria sp. MPI-CAGE-AT-0026]|nr:S-adenosyl-L-methionine-dependent methyltransferase [Ilyonectria sp. MPI-CAGE-AT-0026]
MSALDHDNAEPDNGESDNEPQSPGEASDPDVSDTDSAIVPGDSSTTSITSSIMASHVHHGREYNSKYPNYWGPIDEKQQNALDIMHKVLLLAMKDKLYLPPIKNPQSILDVGTGTGLWAIEAADEFLSATVIGVDITPMQPKWVPPNLEFQIDDMNQDWTFKPFDLIHIRYLQGGIADWSNLYSQAFKSLNPGGWFQHLEPDVQMHSCNEKAQRELDKWAKYFQTVGEKSGESAYMNGFVDVKSERYEIPIGGWSENKAQKEIGRYFMAYMMEALHGFMLQPMTEVLGWTFDEAMVLIATLRTLLRDTKHKITAYIHVVYGQKPTSSHI